MPVKGIVVGLLWLHTGENESWFLPLKHTTALEVHPTSSFRFLHHQLFLLYQVLQVGCGIRVSILLTGRQNLSERWLLLLRGRGLLGNL